MATTFKVETADDKSYVGEIRGGFVEIDGVRAPAQNVAAAEIWYDNGYFGHFELMDGTRLSVRGHRSQGIFRKRVSTNWSGEILIYVESIGKELLVSALHVRRILPWSRAESS